MKYKEIIGDLIDMSLSGSFDIITQGCNCQNTQKSGISTKFVKSFSTDKFPKESPIYKIYIKILKPVEILIKNQQKD